MEGRPLPWQHAREALADFLEERDELVERCRQGLEAALLGVSGALPLEEAAAAVEAAAAQAVNDVASMGSAYGWDLLHTEPARTTSVALATQLQDARSALLSPLSQAALQLLREGDLRLAGPRRLAFWLWQLGQATQLLQAIAEGCGEGGQGRLELMAGTPVELVAALLQLMLVGIRHIDSVSLEGQRHMLLEALETTSMLEAQECCMQRAQRAAGCMARLSPCFPVLELAARQLADRRRRPTEPSPRETILGAALSLLRTLCKLGVAGQEQQQLLRALEAASEASLLPLVPMNCAWLAAVLRPTGGTEAASSPTGSSEVVEEQGLELNSKSPDLAPVPTPPMKRERSRRVPVE